jgi:hypothetical protein
MTIPAKGFIVGALALAGAALAGPEARAMPAGPAALAPAARVERAQFYGYRGPYWRYGLRRPFLGYRRFGFRPYGYGFARPLRPYAFRRPFYGYGYRRF